MKPRVTAVAAVVLALAVVVAPVGGAHTVTVSIHTTDADFNNAATLENVTVTGSGSSASVELAKTESTAGSSLPSGGYTRDSSPSVTGDRGVVVTPNTELNGFSYEMDLGGDEIAIYYHSNSTLITEESTSGSGTINAEMHAGTQYRIVTRNADGSSYFASYDSGYSLPLTSTDFDIDSSYTGGGTSTTELWMFTDLTAQVATYPDKGTYIGANHSGDQLTQAFTDLSLSNASATVTWQYHDGSSWNDATADTYTSSGNKTVSLPSVSSSTWRVNVTFSVTDSEPTATLSGEGVQFETDAPTVDNSSADPQGGDRVNSDPVTLSIPVSDQDFSTSQGDTVTVEFFGNGNSVGTDTLTANGTATTEWSPELGDNEWYAVATDDYGHSQQSQTFKFETPSDITFRNETDASDIITGTSAQVTFYSVSGTIVVRKTDSDGDGNISLAGLPNVPFVVTTDVEGFYNRRIYIDSIYEQQNIYLLNSTAYGGAGSVNTTFVYEDRTGAFEQSNTTLEIERAVDPDGDGNFEWQVVAGDYWGAAGEFPFTGQTQARYRLVITNQQTGDRRVLGTHVPTADGVKNIIVGKVVFDAENATGRYVNAEINQNTTNLQILYSDPTNASTDVQIIVHEQGNKSNELYNQTFAGPLGTKVVTLALNDSQASSNWAVTYDVGDTSDGPKYYKVIVGGGQFPLPIDGDILAAFSYLFVTFVMLLYGPRTALLGAWAGVIVFAGFAFLGWVSGVTVAVPVLIAIGATFYSAANP